MRLSRSALKMKTTTSCYCSMQLQSYGECDHSVRMDDVGKYKHARHRLSMLELSIFGVKIAKELSVHGAAKLLQKSSWGGHVETPAAAPRVPD